MDILDSTKAVAFAEDACFDAERDFMLGHVRLEALEFVREASLAVRRIAYYGTRAVESP